MCAGRTNGRSHSFVLVPIAIGIFATFCISEGVLWTRQKVDKPASPTLLCFLRLIPSSALIHDCFRYLTRFIAHKFNFRIIDL